MAAYLEHKAIIVEGDSQILIVGVRKIINDTPLEHVSNEMASIAWPLLGGKMHLRADQPLSWLMSGEKLTQ
jgi:hypothetical protein